MKRIFFLLTSLLTISYTPSASAEWFEVTGSASVLTSKSAARSHALEDAAYQAMLFSGADISRLKDLKTFLENDEKRYQFSGSEIRSIEVVKEKKKTASSTLLLVLISILRQTVAILVNTKKPL